MVLFLPGLVLLCLPDVGRNGWQASAPNSKLISFGVDFRPRMRCFLNRALGFDSAEDSAVWKQLFGLRDSGHGHGRIPFHHTWGVLCRYFETPSLQRCFRWVFANNCPLHRDGYPWQWHLGHWHLRWHMAQHLRHHWVDFRPSLGLCHVRHVSLHHHWQVSHTLKDYVIPCSCIMLKLLPLIFDPHLLFSLFCFSFVKIIRSKNNPHPTQAEDVDLLSLLI